MAINPVACVTRDILLTSNLGGGGKSKQPVVFAGNGILVKNLVPLVPANKILKILDAGGAKSATFITGLTALPIQNLSNFSSALKRFQVDRAGLGTYGFEVSAMGKADVKARVRVTATLTRLPLRDASDLQGTGPAYSLKPPHAFSCWTNDTAGVDVILDLPSAKRDNVGLEYFFAVHPDVTGSLTIRCQARDSIQVRKSQTFDTNPSSVIETTDAVDATKIKGTNTTTDRDKTVVLSCKAPRLWVAENITANAANTAPLSPDWIITEAS